ncbi:MAG: 16S rRNA (cytidine(1402)-2'-O)-methyltransferase [Holosporaceae bacterium]|nr:16S rRNA (cytidine(1402)-2'-O)-methyltransferase [Holosporaceae bacterium]
MTKAFLSSQLLIKISQKLHSEQHKPGLYIVATPIGNILDITFRALRILEKAKCIFSEDTRQSRKLLNFYEIKTPLISCHEYNEDEVAITSAITNEEIYALISDAGTPLISDPGYRIVNWCISKGLDIFPIPGASASIAGISASGLPTNKFTFYGFVPAKACARRSFLKNIKNVDTTAIFFESPHRIQESLSDMLALLGNRYCCICREMTKIFEEFKRGSLIDLINYYSGYKLRGEFTIIVSGSGKSEINEDEVLSELSEILKTNTIRDSMKKIVEKYDVSKKDFYEKALKINREN